AGSAGASGPDQPTPPAPSPMQRAAPEASSSCRGTPGLEPGATTRAAPGGPAIRGPVGPHGPFGMNPRAELGQALEDFQAGKFGSIPPNALMPHVPDP